MHKYKNIIKNILLFFIGNLIPKLLSFILIPIYTSNLSTSTYGKIELVNTTVALLIPILTLNISDALLRFLLDKKYNNIDVSSSCLYVILHDIIISIIIYTILVIFNPFNIDSIYYIYFIGYLILSTIYNMLCIFLKGIEKVKNLVIGSIINSLLTFIIMIASLLIYDLGITGYVIGSTTGLFFSILYMSCSSKIHLYLKLNFDKKIFIEMIKYSFPMIFSAIAWWVNNSSDRYLLAYISGISISGIYAVSLKIPYILKMFQNVFLQAWSISAIKEFDRNDTDGFIGNIYSIMNMIMVSGCSLLILLNIFISKTLYLGNFFSAWKYVPPLLVSVIFDSLALFIGNLYYAVKDTKTLAFANIIGAFTNVLLNIIFIRRLGAYGAAISTLISYLITFIICYILLKKYIIMKIDKKRILFGHLLIILQMILAIYGNKYLTFEILIFLLMIINYRKYINSVFTTFKKFLIKNNF